MRRSQTTINTLLLISGWLGLLQAVQGQPIIQAVTNAGSGQSTASPGCLITIWGSGFTSTPAQAPSGPFPPALDGVSVTVGGITAPLSYVSSGQINAQIPFEVTGKAADVVVTNGGQSTAPFTISLTNTSPGLISLDGTNALVLAPDFKLRSVIKPRDVFIVYAVGLGPTVPPTPTGGVGVAQPLNSLPTIPKLLLAGPNFALPATILYAGMSSQFPGVYQINATIGCDLLAAVNAAAAFFGSLVINQLVLIDASGVESSNALHFAVDPAPPGASGSISIQYPVTGSQITFSPVLSVANYSVSFEAPESNPVCVAATVSAGLPVVASWTTVPASSPAGGSAMPWVATSAVPTAAERAWDFSGSGITPIDLLAGDRPFPGGVIPLSRLDPVAQNAVQTLPLPNTNIGQFVRSSAVPSGGAAFTDDESFGVYFSLTAPPNSVTANLYVNSDLVATQVVNVSH